MAEHRDIHYRYHEFKKDMKRSNPSFDESNIIELFKCEILNKRLLLIQEEIKLLRKKNRRC